MIRIKSLGRYAAFLTVALFFASTVLFAQDNPTGQNETQTEDAQTQDTQTQDNQTQSTDQQGMSADNQEFTNSAKQLTESLSRHVTLREDQKEQINTALVNYYSSVLKENSESGTDANGNQEQTDQSVGQETDVAVLDQQLNDQISSILDDAQKSQWTAIQSNWWTEVRTNVDELRKDAMSSSGQQRME